MAVPCQNRKQSVLPTTRVDKRPGQSGPVLLATKGSSIKTYGTYTFSPLLMCLAFCWELRSNSLNVDLKGKQLMDAETYHSVPLQRTRTASPHLSIYDVLLAEFPTITTLVFTSSSIKLRSRISFPLKAPLVHAHAHRLPLDKLANMYLCH